MRRLLIAYIIFPLIPVLTNAQWEPQYNIPQGGNVNAVFFASPTAGWIIGDSIKKTTNFGINWAVQHTPGNYISIHFIDENTGMIGAANRIFRTTNGGVNWLPGISPEPVTNIWVIDQDTAFHTRDVVIYKSTDFGLSWRMVAYSFFFNNISSIYFPTPYIGFACGECALDAQIRRTGDGGNNWGYIDLFSSPRVCHSIAFADSAVGYLVMDKFVYRTTNSGFDWDYVQTSPVILNKLSVINEPGTSNHIVSVVGGEGNDVVGYKNIFMRSKNGLENWIKTSFVGSQAYPLRDVHFTGKDSGVIVGKNGVVLRTTNGGLNWSSLSPRKTFYSCSFIDVNNGITVGDFGTVLRTTDSGINWKLKTTNTLYDLLSVTYVNSNIVFAAGRNGTLIKSSNAGESWSLLSSGSIRNLYDIEFFNSSFGYAAGDSGTVIKTTNGGSTWSSVNIGSSSNLRTVSYLDLNTIIVAGENGTIYKSTNGGTNWINVSCSYAAIIHDLYTLNYLEWIIVLDNGKILKTVNGGVSWSQKYSGQAKLYALSYADYIFAAGENGTFLRSEDSGDNWVSFSGVSHHNLLDVDFVSSTTGWVVGGFGTILKNIVGGVPVEFSSFTAELTGSSVELYWETKTELNNRGYEVVRKSEEGNWITRGFVAGAGTSTESHKYSFIDELSLSGKYFYRLVQMDFNGDYQYSPTIEIDFNYAPEFSLEQNYPNPFNPVTTIKYRAAAGSNAIISLKVYDVLGNEIEVLVNEIKSAGDYEVQWDATAFTSGVYFYTLKAGDYISTKKLLLMK